MTKDEKYRLLVEQVRAMVAGERDEIANMANIAAMVHEAMGNWWTGFYRVVGDELVLGPFQGPVACTRIGFGKGVCGAAWERKQTVIVPDVHQFKGHIACSSASNSEIVLPVMRGEEVVAVLDIDSTEFGAFDEVDGMWLEKIVGSL